MSKSRKQVRVGFLSFFKLNLLYGIALGQLSGVAFLIIAISGGPVDLNLGSWHVTGLTAGILSVVLLPPAFGIVSFVVAPLLFLPFMLAVRFLGSFDGS
jgi:hypothetical protein